MNWGMLREVGSQVYFDTLAICPELETQYQAFSLKSNNLKKQKQKQTNFAGEHISLSM